MQPVTRYGSLLVRETQKTVFRQQGPIARFGNYGSAAAVGKSRDAIPWTCEDCRDKLRRSVQQRERLRDFKSEKSGWVQRAFGTSARQYEDERIRKSVDPHTATTHSVDPAPPAPPEVPISRAPQAVPSPPTPFRHSDDLTIPDASSSTLPSRFASRRHHLSQRLAKLADDLLSKASLASQQINTYTGTDFSGIESLRSNITTQEQAVKAQLALVSEAKDRHVESHAKQATSQKEIVGLLERKSSWGPADLERYMSLVRSEHLDEQGVSTAKNDLADAERELEDARALLERLERKQYHEEQIWSDTIRRNSTWVTIGLMGLNIVLLLANIAIFEPWRRRKIVREVKAALDEKSISHPAPEPAQGLVPASQPEIVAEPELKAAAVEELAPKADSDPALVVAEDAATAGAIPLAAGEVLPEEVVNVSERAAEPAAETTSQPTVKPGSYEEKYETYRLAFLDLFSERLVELKKVDVTTIALQGAASGVAVMGLLFLLLRPK